MTLGIEGWLDKLADKKIPILKSRRDQMLELLTDEKASLAECNPIVLSDPLMAANLFRRMNQQRLKDNRLPITTVSSLLSLFGNARLLQEIKTMVCVEDLNLPAVNLHGIESCLKQSWYCTQFAMRWVSDRGVKEPEEVHVAAVLQSVPELMLWCYGGDALPRIHHRAYYECKVYYEEVEKELGCGKRKIGCALAEIWALPELAGFGFETKFNAYTHGTAIGLAAVLARICQHSWYGSDMEFFHKKATHYFGELENKVAIHFHRQLLSMVDDELELGYRPVAFMLLFTDDKKYPEQKYCLASEIKTETAVKQKAPQKPEAESKSEPVNKKADVQESFEADKFSKDSEQLKQLLKEKAGFNDLFKHTILSVHKTLGFERVVFLVSNPDKTKMVTKLNLFSGQADDSLKQFEIDMRVKGLFNQVMLKPQAFCLNANNYQKFWKAIPGKVKSSIQVESFCAVSIFSGDKPVGMIYADKLNTAITPELFKAFQQITMMLNKALEILKKNNE